ncbi:hypothetical protein PHLCEN_2v5634 [Hermanssonia centrifuga]|uniref:Uncharacterized protein n=1 Tax=Hermanssonia centrifuga TaxID=98765 RepID=A0A2R6P1U1_9APHY|nr:hypothetical protein PHLCEN_2v5634 [Hermanssonia centrifuga]
MTLRAGDGQNATSSVQDSEYAQHRDIYPCMIIPRRCRKPTSNITVGRVSLKSEEENFIIMRRRRRAGVEVSSRKLETPCKSASMMRLKFV